MRLRSRLVVSISYILVAVIAALAIPLAINLSRRARAELESDTLITAQTLAAYIGAENLRDVRALRRIARGAPSQIERVVVTDLDGVVIYDTAGEATGQDFVNDERPEMQVALAGDPTAEIRFSEELGRDILVAAAPVIDERLVGAIRVTRNAQEVTDAVRRTWLVLAAMGAAGVLAGVVIAFGLAGSLSRPLQQLSGAATELGEGDLTSRVGEVEGAPEIHELATSFDEMAARLERTVTAQREFVANASHQLRTPLTAMKLRLEAAIASASDPQVRTQLEAADAEVDRLSQIVDRLLVMARHIEEGAAARVELRTVADEAVSRWQARAERLDSVLTAGGNGGVAHADPTDVDQIVDNLVSNALAYAPGAIGILSDTANGYAWIAVRDHGPGISPDERARVTERFYRGHGAPPGGSGLGLAIARDLAEKWGGTLKIADGDEGGAEVRASFPEAGS
jgi:signal transduction histidine kinase